MYITSYSVIRINVAAQVLRETVANVLNNFGPEEAAGTRKFCLMIDKLFNCLTVGNTKEYITNRKPFLKPSEPIDIRFV